MKEKFFKTREGKKMVFTNWTRKSNSIFLSLNKAIKISALSAGYFILNAFNTVAQTDTVKIQEITVSAYKNSVSFADAARMITIVSSEELSEAPLTGIQDALKSVLNVDLRERGVYGVQSDLNIRGGSFDQNVVLINGVRMNDPQTGHFQMNLPIDLVDIERIEMLHGPSSNMYGNNAFSGAVNLITGFDSENGIKFHFLGGEHELYGGNLSINLSTKNFKNYLSIAKKASAGYAENTDFDILNLFYNGKLITNAGNLQLQAGYLDKSFGANNFYTPRYPNQYEQNKTWMGSLKFFSSGKTKISPSVYYRKNFDRFELFRNNPASWYTGHNYHTTDVYGADVASNFTTSIGQIAVGADWNTEGILSNKLGEVLDNEQAIPDVDSVKYTNGKSRQNFSFFYEEEFKSGKISTSVRIMANYNTMFGWNYYPGIDFSYGPGQKVKLIASANWSGRLPTYTDLYYIGPDNIGNLDIKPEKANTYETGIKYLDKNIVLQSVVFYRLGKDIIDWVKIDQNDPWQSQNITKINTFGYEFSAKISFKGLYSNKFPINAVQLNYSYLDMDKKSDEYSSKYVLDYLRHNANLIVNHNIIKNLTANWQFNFQYRNGSYIPYTEENGVWAWRTPEAYKPLFLLDLKLNYKVNKLNLFVQAKNILDVRQQNIENVWLPGRWISGGLSFSIGLR